MSAISAIIGSEGVLDSGLCVGGDGGIDIEEREGIS